MRTSGRTLACLLACLLLCLSFPGMSPAQQAGREPGLSEVAPGGPEDYRAAVASYFSGSETKIVGGKQAPLNAFPWQASIEVSWIDDPYRAHFCGGTIYADKWIVTAAHCVVSLSPKEISVTVGTNQLGSGGARFTVNRVISKSNYDPKTKEHDIALLELVRPLTFGSAVKSIPIVTPEQEPALMKPGADATVVGWGSTSADGKAVRDLRYVTVPIVDRTVCNRPLAYDGQVTANMLCAGEVLGGKDSCQGDSGGPLTVDTSTGPKLAGVVSFGKGCALPNLVGIYTRAPNYLAWITSCIASPSACQ
jgi:secreted trypsin-like serine protease